MGIDTAIQTLETKTKSRNGETYVYYKITPEWVTSLNLKDPNGVNAKNRNMSRERVVQLKNDFECGMWKEDADPIKYLDDVDSPDHGILLSGQHRLEAIRLAGVSVFCRFEGVASDCRLLVDSNRSRTIATNMGISLGYSSREVTLMQHYYAIISELYNRNGTVNGSGAMSQNFSTTKVESIFSPYIEAIRLIRNRHKQCNSKFNLVAYQAFLLSLSIAKAPDALVTEFIINTSFAGSCTSPRMKTFLDSLAVNDKTSVVGNQYKTLIRAWNYMIDENYDGSYTNKLCRINTEVVDIFK